MVVVVVLVVVVVVGAAVVVLVELVVVVGAAVVELVVVVGNVVVVVVGPNGQTPSAGGFIALKSFPSLFVSLLPGPKSTSYRSPDVLSTPSCSAKHASVPGSGGTIETGPFFPAIDALIVNIPLLTPVPASTALTTVNRESEKILRRGTLVLRPTGRAGQVCGRAMHACAPRLAYMAA